MTTQLLLAPERTQFTVKRPIWQQEGIGFQVEHSIFDPVEALILAAANWGVYQTKLTANLVDPNTEIPYLYEDTNLYGVFRETDNQYLGAVGNGFKIVQNVNGFNWFLPFLQGEHAYIESAGTLRNGEIVWVVARLTEDSSFEIVPDDTVEQRLLLTLCHNTRRSPQATFINTRTVCQNVLGQASHTARSNQSLMRMRQTKSIDTQMINVGKKIDLARACFSQDVNAYRRLANILLSVDRVRDLLKVLYAEPLSKIVEKPMGVFNQRYTLDTYRPTRIILEALETQTELQLPYVVGTAWALYNAIAHYYTYREGERRRGSALTKTEAQLEALWFVDKKNILNQALDLLLG